MIAPKLAIAAAATALFAAAGAQAQTVKADLDGFSQVPTLSVAGAGSFSAKIRPRVERIDYELSYRDLSAPVQQAHIHLGAAATNGGVSAFLCTNLGNSPTAPLCPGPTAGVVSGSIFPGDVIGPAAQGLPAGGFDQLVAAIRAGATYVNVHTDAFPAGELRGRIE